MKTKFGTLQYISVDVRAGYKRSEVKHGTVLVHDTSKGMFVDSNDFNDQINEL